MSDLIDRNVLKAKMYQEAFESDTDMQKWDSGCWIRYKLFTKVVDSTPTVPYVTRWVRCEDRLPNENEVVIAYGALGEIISATYDKAWGWQDDTGSFKIYGVTHWMPIEPPKDDA